MGKIMLHMTGKMASQMKLSTLIKDVIDSRYYCRCDPTDTFDAIDIKLRLKGRYALNFDWHDIAFALDQLVQRNHIERAHQSSDGMWQYRRVEVSHDKG